MRDRWPITVNDFGCWEWQGKLDLRGYPVIWHGHRPSSAHREVYTAEVGPIVVGFVLDHLCRNRACVAPIHLEPVTQSENEMRKSFTYRQRRLVNCPKGHGLTLYGIRTPWGGRVCRVCRDTRSPECPR